MTKRVQQLMSAALESHQPSVSPEDIAASFEAAELASYDVVSVENVYQTLGRISDAIEVSLESQTLTDSSLEMAKIAVGSSASQLGVTMESMATFDGPEKATVTLESLADTLKRLWDTIKTVVSRAIKAVRDFFSKLFGGLGKIKKQLESQLGEVKKLDEDPKDTIKTQATSYLSYNGKVSVSSILEGLKSQEEVGEFLMGDWLTSAEGWYDGILRANLDKKFTGSMGNDIPEDVEDEEALTKLIAQRVGNAFKYEFDIRKVEGNRLLGDFIAKLERKDVHRTALRVAMIHFSRSEKNLGHNNSAELSAPTRKELESMLEGAIDVVKLIEKKKSSLDGLSKTREKVTKSFDDFVKESERNKLGAFWTSSRARQYMSLANVAWAHPIQQYCNHSYSSVRAVSDLVARALKA